MTINKHIKPKHSLPIKEPIKNPNNVLIAPCKT